MHQQGRLLLPTLITWVWSWGPTWERTLGNFSLTSVCMLWQVHVQGVTHVWSAVVMLVTVLWPLEGFGKSQADVRAYLSTFCLQTLAVLFLSPSCYQTHSSRVRGLLRQIRLIRWPLRKSLLLSEQAASASPFVVLCLKPLPLGGSVLRLYRFSSL